METRLAEMFGDNCVLQREKPCPVWGKAKPLAKVCVEIQGKKAETAADEEGNWRVMLPPLAVSREETLRITVQGEAESIVVKNVAVGDVWLLGGQSNMEFFLRYEKHVKAEFEREACADIRFFDYPEVSYKEQRSDFDYSRFGFWRRLDRENIEYFSAVGYYFSRFVYESEQIPIGLLGCNWGGTPACAWIGEEDLLPACEKWEDEYERDLKKFGIGLSGDYLLHREWSGQVTEAEERARLAHEEKYRSSPMTDNSNPFGNPGLEKLLFGTTPEEQQEMMRAMAQMGAPEGPMTGPLHPNRPCGLYHTMLEQVAPYAMTGVLWYQGESDALHAEDYVQVLTAMIRSWRKLWKEELPFYVVQLTGFEQWLQCDGKAYPEVRKAQEIVAGTVKDVHLAAIPDVGEQYDIHPKDKKTVGERLARLALKYEYGRQIPADAATVEKCAMEGQCVRIAFRTDAGGLRAEGEVGREIKVYDPETNAEVDKSGYVCSLTGNVLEIRFSVPVRKSRIVYCGGGWCQGNLFDEAGLAVFPFDVTVP